MFLKDCLASVSRMDYGGEEAKRKGSEEAPACLLSSGVNSLEGGSGRAGTQEWSSSKGPLQPPLPHGQFMRVSSWNRPSGSCFVLVERSKERI